MRLICGAQLCSASFEAMCLTCPAAVWQQMPAHPTTLALTAGEQHRKLPTAFADAHSYIVAVPEQAPGSALVLDHTFQDVWRVGCGAAPCQARTALQRCMRRLAAACEAGRQASRRCAATSAQKARRSCSARCAPGPRPSAPERGAFGLPRAAAWILGHVQVLSGVTGHARPPQVMSFAPCMQHVVRSMLLKRA